MTLLPGVSRGQWYFEVKIMDMPEGTATRMGWSQSLGTYITMAPLVRDHLSDETIMWIVLMIWWSYVWYHRNLYWVSAVIVMFYLWCKIQHLDDQNWNPAIEAVSHFFSTRLYLHLCHKSLYCITLWLATQMNLMYQLHLKHPPLIDWFSKMFQQPKFKCFIFLNILSRIYVYIYINISVGETYAHPLTSASKF